MDPHINKTLPNFLEVLGLDEEPMGLFYADDRPAEGFSPVPIDLPTREKEIKFFKTDELSFTVPFPCLAPCFTATANLS